MVILITDNSLVLTGRFDGSQEFFGCELLGTVPAEMEPDRVITGGQAEVFPVFIPECSDDIVVGSFCVEQLFDLGFVAVGVFEVLFNQFHILNATAQFGYGLRIIVDADQQGEDAQFVFVAGRIG